MKRGLIIFACCFFIFGVFFISNVQSKVIEEGVESNYFTVSDQQGGAIISYIRENNHYVRFSKADGELSDPILIPFPKNFPEKSDTYIMKFVSDLRGGAMILYTTVENLKNNILSLNFLDKNGNLKFESSIVILSIGSPNQPDIIPDGYGGAFIFWTDAPSDNRIGSIYINHIDSQGNLKFSEPTPFFEGGKFPKAMLSEQDSFKLTWFDRLGRMYANFYDFEINSFFNLIEMPALYDESLKITIQNRMLVSDGREGLIVIFPDIKKSVDGFVSGLYASLLDLSGALLYDGKLILRKNINLDDPFQHSVINNLINGEEKGVFLAYACNLETCTPKGVYGGFYDLDDFFDRPDKLPELFRPILILEQNSKSEIDKTSLVSDGKGNTFIFARDWDKNLHQRFLTKDGEVFDFPPIGKKKFIRGDSDRNGQLQLNDAVFILRFLFQESEIPKCLDAADADDNGQIQLTDAVRILNHLFKGDPDLPAPYPGAGGDPSEDGLDCQI